MQIKKLLAMIVCAAGLSAAQATLQPLVTQDSFEGAVLGKKVWIDNLEAFGNEFDNGSGNVALTFTRSSEANRTGTLNGNRGIQWINPANPPSTFGRQSHAGGDVYWEGGDDATKSFVVTIAGGTTAFGFWASDIGDFAADCSELAVRPPSCDDAHSTVLQVVLTFADGSTDLFEVGPNEPDARGNELFRGVVSANPIVSVEFINLTGGADGQGFDYFMVGDRDPSTPAPEPGGIALAALALLAAGRVSRRVRR